MKQEQQNIIAIVVLVIVLIGLLSFPGYQYFLDNFTKEGKFHKQLEDRFIRVYTAKKMIMPLDTTVTIDPVMRRFISVQDCTFMFQQAWIDSLEYPNDPETRKKLLRINSEELFNSGLWNKRRLKSLF